MVGHRLAAVVSLAFVVSQCAIDDRDLEEHGGDDDSGGSSNGGSSSGRGGTASGGTASGGTASGGTAGIPIDCQRDEDDEDCFACEKAACCDEYQACFASDDCLDYVYCGAGCLDTACIVACGVDFPDGEAIFLDFTSCGEASCAEIC